MVVKLSNQTFCLSEIIQIRCEHRILLPLTNNKSAIVKGPHLININLQQNISAVNMSITVIIISSEFVIESACARLKLKMRCPSTLPRVRASHNLITYYSFCVSLFSSGRIPPVGGAGLSPFSPSKPPAGGVGMLPSPNSP